MFLGNFSGFNIYDIANPKNPKLIASVVCPGGQGDVSVRGNLLIMSVEQTRGRIDCGTAGVAEPVSAERFRGVRIFDITDVTKPKQLAAVQTCRGSHTHTLLEDPDDKDNIWYTGQRCGRVGKVNPVTGMVVDFVVPGGGGPHTNIRERYAHVEALAEADLLRLAIIDPGSVSLGPLDGDGVPAAIDLVYQNTFADVRHMVESCRARGLAAHVSIFEPGFLRVALAYHAAGLFPPAKIQLYREAMWATTRCSSTRGRTGRTSGPTSRRPPRTTSSTSAGPRVS